MRGLKLSLSRFGLGILLLTGCATTHVRVFGQDPQFRVDHIQKCMIINMGEDQAVRASVEDEFVRQWAKRGVTAIASYRVFPAGTKLERGPVAALARAQQCDSVLVTRLVGAQKIDPGVADDEFEPAPPAELSPGTTEFAKAIVASPQYAGNYRMAEVLTRIYEVKTEKRIWSAVSDVLVAKEVAKLIKPFVKDVLHTLYSAS